MENNKQIAKKLYESLNSPFADGDMMTIKDSEDLKQEDIETIKKFLDTKDLTLKDQLDAGKKAAEALELVNEVWSRANLHPEVNFLGDDEHEAWAKVIKALLSCRKVGLI